MDMQVKQAVPVLTAVVLVLLYPLLIYSLPLNIQSTCNEDSTVRGVTDQVGFCTEIGFDVSRSYYAGLLRLPVYRLGINLDLLNKTFLPLFLGIGIASSWWLGRRDEHDENTGGHGYTYDPDQ